MNTNITLKLFLSIAFSLLWLLFSLWLGQWWIQDLANDFGAVGAYVIFTGIAGIPGTATAFILASIFFRSTENYDFSVGQPRVPVTIIVAAFNEESRIYKTLLSIKRQNYYGGIRTIVVDDGSEDSTTPKGTTIHLQLSKYGCSIGPTRTELSIISLPPPISGSGIKRSVCGSIGAEFTYI